MVRNISQLRIKMDIKFQFIILTLCNQIKIQCIKICALLCAHKSEVDGTPFFSVFVGWDYGSNPVSRITLLRAESFEVV